MSWMIEYFLPFILILTVLVFVHEWGHFIVARRNGVRVTVFSIGFGPELFGWTDRHETRWSFCLVPMGGYVKMLGDTDASSAKSDTSQLSASEKLETLEAKTPAQRIAVAAAGPAANFIFAIFALTLLMCMKGLPFFPATIGVLDPTLLAAKSGFLVGDHIESINGAKVENFEDLRSHILKAAGSTMQVQIKRGDQNQTLSVDMFEKDEKTGEKKPVSRLGVGPGAPEYKPQNPASAFVQSFTVTWNICAQTLSGLSSMIMGKKGAGDLGGFLAIGDMASQSAKNGAATVLWFMALLSINLGLINLFPIPVLDGGHIVMCGIEWIRGKPLGEKLQERIYFAGLMIVLSLMFYATWNDFSRYGILNHAVGLFSKVKLLLGL